MALVLLGAGAAIVSTGIPAAQAARVVGGNFPINVHATDKRSIDAHNSPALAQNPTNPANLVVANRVDTPAYSCAVHVSFNGGASWGQRGLPIPAGEEEKCYAPEVAFAGDGTLYILYATLKGLGNTPNAMWLVTSADGGRTVSPVSDPPVPVLGPLSFQVRLAVDPVVPRRLYVTTLQAQDVGLYRFVAPGNPINFYRSDDGGKTWQGPVQVNAPVHERAVAPTLAVGRNGELYVLYLDLGGDKLDYEGAHQGIGGPPYPGPWHLVLARSRDRGATWTETVVERNLVPTERFIVFIPHYPALALDPSGRRVYVSYQDGRLDDADVWLWTSSDGGERFSRAVRVNDTEPRDGTAQYMPKVAVDPTGRLDILYYDRRNDREKNVRNEVSLQSSFDGGRTFTDRVRLSDRSFDSGVGTGSERGMPDLGSRLALLSTRDRAFAVWTDTRSGTQASNKQDLFRAVVDIGHPPRVRASLRTASSAGGVGTAALGLFLLVWGLVSRRRALRRAR